MRLSDESGIEQTLGARTKFGLTAETEKKRIMLDWPL
jgi:hypothetical protein